MQSQARHDEERRHWEEARLRLVRLGADGAVSLETMLGRVAGIAARAMDVERVSVWRLDEASGGLRTVLVWDVASPSPDRCRLVVQDLGAYASMLRQRRVVVADDVARDPATADLIEPYFAPLRVTSTIDAPIYRDGRVVGVCCHEHRGPPRAWTAAEADFAVSVAEVVALELTSAELRELQEVVLEHEREQQESMRDEAIARMARGVAHDVNNLLAIVLGALAVLRRATPDSPDLRAQSEVIEEAARSASRLVRDLLEVGRAVDDEGECALDDALQDVVPAMRAAAAGRALAIVPDAPRKTVPISRARLEQVLLNLVMNARDATADGGRVEVHTRVVDEGRVEIEVRDDGEGVDEEARERMFEPYFTTKVEGQGLGLPTVLAIVRGARGTIDVTSERGRGSSVRVELPARTSDVATGLDRSP
ncbi:MAG: GAF domain-containing sensor histidine kinase [Myxococcota bacterium]|nr:GAF domain-containing sensor histidine kinase [Myxococcota bacterium]